MSDNSKFTFGASSGTPTTPSFGGNTTGGSSLFGGNNNANAGSGPTLGGSKPAGSLFGSTGNTPASTGGSLFGNTATTKSESQKPLFGALGSGTTGTTPSLFGGGGGGGTSNTSTPTFSFGQKPAASSGSTTPGNLFGGPTTTAPSSTPTQAPSTNLFGASTGNSQSLFGNLDSKPATSNPGSGASTPAAPKTGFSFGSTTPAGPPPGGNTSNLFGGQANQANAGEKKDTPSLFGQKPATTSSSTTPNLFGVASSNTSTPMFGGAASKPAQSTPSLFGSRPAATTASSHGQQPATTQPNLFGGLQVPKTGGQESQATPGKSLFSTDPTASTPGTSSTTASNPPTFSLNMNSTTPGQNGSQTPASSAPSSNLFGQKPATTTPAAPTTNLFGTGASNPPQPASSAATPSLFSNLGKPSASSGAPSNSTTATTGATPASSSAAPTTTTTAATPSLFSGFGQNPTTTTPAQPAAPTTSTAAPTGNVATGGAAAAPLASSTTGPTPSTTSRLKNKSMDEIITRWASDLSKYQKDFQQQAEQVAVWDRTLVENSDKVSKLFGKTFYAERDATEVERQLTIVENGQEELSMYLDKYEKEIDSLISSQMAGKEGLRGPDQERERTYKLAEKLQDRLNELNGNLGEMIGDINTVSQSLSKTGKPDDPLTKVVRVLNSHLAQLQLIDSGAQQLQEKIKTAQKEGQRIGHQNGWQGLGSDPAEDFYRSFRGSRSERFGGVS